MPSPHPVPPSVPPSVPPPVPPSVPPAVPPASAPSVGNEPDDPDPAIDGGIFLLAVAATLPEFWPTAREMIEAGDGEPGDPVVLLELADFVADHLAALGDGRPVLRRALDLIEVLIGCAADPEATSELVGMAFFDSFSLEDRRRLGPWLGPRSRDALEALDLS